jgi:hypothetical protein
VGVAPAGSGRGGGSKGGRSEKEGREERKPVASRGRSQRSFVTKCVGVAGQAKRWDTVWEVEGQDGHASSIVLLMKCL